MPTKVQKLCINCNFFPLDFFLFEFFPADKKK